MLKELLMMLLEMELNYSAEVDEKELFMKPQYLIMSRKK